MSSLLKLKILVIDDDLSFINSISMFLKDKGHTVFTAKSTREAVELAEKQKKNLLPIDLAIIDYILPDDSGIHISNELFKIDPFMYRVALTEHSTVENKKKLIQEGGFIQIISKFDSTDVIDRMLEAVLSSKRERQEKGIY